MSSPPLGCRKAEQPPNAMPSSAPPTSTVTTDSAFWESLLADVGNMELEPRYARAANAILSHPKGELSICAISNFTASRLHELLAECPQYALVKPTPVSNLYHHFHTVARNFRQTFPQGCTEEESQRDEVAGNTFGFADQEEHKPGASLEEVSCAQNLLEKHRTGLEAPIQPHLQENAYHHCPRRGGVAGPSVNRFPRGCPRRESQIWNCYCEGRFGSANCDGTISSFESLSPAYFPGRHTVPKPEKFDFERRKLYVEAISMGAVGSTLVFGFAVSSLIDSMQALGTNDRNSGYIFAYLLCMCTAIGITGFSTLLSSGLAVQLHRTLAMLGRDGVLEHHVREAKWAESMAVVTKVAPFLLISPFAGLGCVMAGIVTLAFRLIENSIAALFAGILGLSFAFTLVMAFYLRLHSVALADRP